jgi:(2Fe-2S) ferredoxin
VDEFKAVLTKWNLLYDEGINPDGIKVSICSHIGGHAFAGNMIFYPGDGQASIWYGKVFPHHVQGIVHETIVKGNIIEDLLRGTGLPAQDTLSHALASEPEPEPFVPPVTDRI